MKFKQIGVALLIASIILVTGCSRVKPVHTVQDEPYPTWQGQNVTQDDISKAIMKAGKSLGWIMQKKGEGHILGTLSVRSHKAIVDINYDDSKYSITYNDSENLLYDGGNIHRNYNNWIINLTNSINVYLSEL